MGSKPRPSSDSPHLALDRRDARNGGAVGQTSRAASELALTVTVGLPSFSRPTSSADASPGALARSLAPTERPENAELRAILGELPGAATAFLGVR
ncbi:MAG: hypothetical protein ACI867_000059 [Glaciecola sp.]|jgi:hypothetical protein